MQHLLVFFHVPSCGHSRRMDSLVDHFLRTHRDHLKLAKVDMNERPDLAKRFGATTAPTLLLVERETMREVARLEGRSTLPDIKSMFEPALGIEQQMERPELQVAGAC